MRRRELAELLAENLDGMPAVLDRAEALCRSVERAIAQDPSLDPVGRLGDDVRAFRSELKPIAEAMARRKDRDDDPRVPRPERKGKVRVKKSPKKKRRQKAAA
jgi:hypothetical protein